MALAYALHHCAVCGESYNGRSKYCLRHRFDHHTYTPPPPVDESGRMLRAGLYAVTPPDLSWRALPGVYTAAELYTLLSERRIAPGSVVENEGNRTGTVVAGVMGLIVEWR